MYALLAAAVLARAAEPVELPSLNSQRFRPSIDAERFVWADDSTVGQRGRFTGRAMFSFTENPLVYVYDDGRVEPIVGHLVQLNLLAGYAVGPVRVGLDVPVYLRSFGGSTEDITDVGDMAVDVKGRILDRSTAPLGLAVDGRLGMPTSLVPALGSDNFSGEIGVIADRDVGALRLAGAVGAIFVPDAPLATLTWGPQAFFRLGAGYAVNERSGLGLDLNGNSPFAEGDPEVSFPVEAMVSGWVVVGNGVVLRAGLGSGLTAGLGAPSFRGVFSLGYEPQPRRDTDGDGLWDKDDKCPSEAEDGDEFEDDDGCPELTRLRLTFVDKDTRKPIRDVSSGVGGREARGDRELDLAPESYALQASAPGYEQVRMMVQVPPGKPLDRVIAMQREVAQGRLVLKVVDAAGLPMEASLALPGVVLDRPTAGLDRNVMAGELGLVAKAAGFATVRQTLSVATNETTTVTVTLRPARVAVKEGRIEPLDPVQFVTGRDLLQPSSFSVLDEVASVLLDHPELGEVRVGGYTDTRGSDAENLALSDAMAASVRQYLVDRGVPPGRLVAVGFGEVKGRASGGVEFIVNAPR